MLSHDLIMCTLKRDLLKYLLLENKSIHVSNNMNIFDITFISLKVTLKLKFKINFIYIWYISKVEYKNMCECYYMHKLYINFV